MPRRKKYQHRKKAAKDARDKRLACAKRSKESASDDVSSDIHVTDEPTQDDVCLTPLTPSPSSSQEYSRLQLSLTLPNCSWSNQSNVESDELLICKISRYTQPLKVTHSLTVDRNFNWVLFINDNRVDPSNCAALQPFDCPLDSMKLNNLLSTLDTLRVCAGHPEDHFERWYWLEKGNC